LLACRPLRLHLFQMYTDSFFLWAADKAVRVHLSRNTFEDGAASIYYYYFAYRGPHSFSEFFGDPTRDFGKFQKKFVFHIPHFITYFLPSPSFFVVKLIKDKCPHISHILVLHMQGNIHKRCSHQRLSMHGELDVAIDVTELVKENFQLFWFMRSDYESVVHVKSTIKKLAVTGDSSGPVTSLSVCSFNWPLKWKKEEVMTWWNSVMFPSSNC